MSVENDSGESDWWEGALEEDLTWTLPLDGEGGLWNSGFPPPPPRPPFLEDIAPDGLTTCDLCTWARAPQPGPHLYDSSLDIPGPLTWTISLMIVSVISALLGAALMVTLLHCRRSQDEEPRIFRWFRRRRGSDNHRESNMEGDNKEVVTLQTISGGGNRVNSRGKGVWSWLSRRPPQVPPVPPVPALNHYTMEEAYAAMGEALYAELDRPAYQNTGYVSDAEPLSSAPSSAYYSDLSNGDRTYESVGVGTVSVGPGGQQTGVGALWDPTRLGLGTISENLSLSVPSDYV